VRLLILLMPVMVVVPALAETPDCSGTGDWPTMSTFSRLKFLGIADDVLTAKTRTTRIASEKIGKDLYRQVHRITFTEVSGKTVEAIVVNNVSSEECSMSSVEIFMVSKHLKGQK
jgi:hypothetical protein